MPARKLNDEERKALYDLAMEHLKNVYTRKQAETYLETGIPEEPARRNQGRRSRAARRYGRNEDLRIEKQLQYVGRRTISKYGCSGCHDVPGFEDAKPIGTGLADWARKTPDKLAFEQIVEYMKKGHGHPDG